MFGYDYDQERFFFFFNRLKFFFSRCVFWLSQFLVLALIILFIIITIGFSNFSYQVVHYTSPNIYRPVDAVIVLTGGMNRMKKAGSLLLNGVAGKLFVSGANARVDESEIFRAAGLDKNIHQAVVDIGFEAQDTSGNAKEIAIWLKKNNIKSMALVTNNYHMPRSLYLLRYENIQAKIIPYAVVNKDLKQINWLFDRDTMRLLLSEYGKLILAFFKREVLGNKFFKLFFD